MLIPGSRQTFSNIAIGIGTTPIGFVSNILGAKAVLVRTYGGGNANTFTASAVPSLDGINEVSAGVTLTATGTGRTDLPGGCCSIITITGTTTGPFTEIPFPYMQLKGVFGTAGTTVQVQVWPLYETHHPNIAPVALLPS